MTPFAAADGTIAAVATASGSGALAIVRLSGPQALLISRQLLHPKNPAAEFLPRQAVLAQAGDADGPIDEVIATYFPGPASATGEDVVEISCHGSTYITKRLLESILRAGARLAMPGEFTQRAFLNSRLDLAQAEAVADLIRARNRAAHQAALVQLQGGLSAAVDEIRDSIIEVLARIEANLDHPEEDIPSLSEEEFCQALSSPKAAISDLAKTFARGRLAAEGARVCLVGRPNAGKSSLLNALLGSERAIVCPTPGTTRDTIEEETIIAGTSSILIDTAGLREEESLEQAEIAGIKRTQAALRSSDLVLLVIDGSKPLTPEDERVHQDIMGLAVQSGRPALRVLNKTDIAQEASAAAIAVDVRISALRRQGLDALRSLMSERMAREEREPSRVVITSLRHQEALQSAGAELQEALLAPNRYPGQWEDRAASHLRECLCNLGSIVGEGTTDDILARIFTRFCVGK